MERYKYLKVAEFREQLMLFIFLANEWIAEQCNKCPNAIILNIFRHSNEYIEANLYISLLTENSFDRNLIAFTDLPDNGERMKLLNNILVNNNISTGFLEIMDKEYEKHQFRCNMTSREQRDKRMKMKNIFDNAMRDI